MKVHMLISTIPPYLPVGVFDTKVEVANYLGITNRTIDMYKSDPDHIYTNKLTGERVTLLTLNINLEEDELLPCA